MSFIEIWNTKRRNSTLEEKICELKERLDTMDYIVIGAGGWTFRCGRVYLCG